MSGYSCQICKREKPGMELSGSRYCEYCKAETKNDVFITVSDTVTMRDSFRLKVKAPSFKKFKSLVIGGWHKSKIAEHGVDLLRSFDKEKDIYNEVVKDYKTGEIIHKTEEKLTDHIGHGSAKVDLDGLQGKKE